VLHFAGGTASAHTQLVLTVQGQLLPPSVLHSLQFASVTLPCGAAEALHLWGQDPSHGFSTQHVGASAMPQAFVAQVVVPATRLPV
jgi:hypothetical protein